MMMMTKLTKSKKKTKIKSNVSSPNHLSRWSSWNRKTTPVAEKRRFRWVGPCSWAATGHRRNPHDQRNATRWSSPSRGSLASETWDVPYAGQVTSPPEFYQLLSETNTPRQLLPEDQQATTQRQTQLVLTGISMFMWVSQLFLKVVNETNIRLLKHDLLTGQTSNH